MSDLKVFFWAQAKDNLSPDHIYQVVDGKLTEIKSGDDFDFFQMRTFEIKKDKLEEEDSVILGYQKDRFDLMFSFLPQLNETDFKDDLGRLSRSIMLICGLSLESSDYDTEVFEVFNRYAPEFLGKIKHGNVGRDKEILESFLRDKQLFDNIKAQKKCRGKRKWLVKYLLLSATALVAAIVIKINA
jgi:hypothetical protein